MRTAVRAAALAAACAAAGAHAADGDWQLSLRSDHHSDATRLRDLEGAVGRAPRPRGGRNVGYIDDEVRVSRQVGAWRFSLLARSHATLKTNDDTLDAAAQVAGLAPPAGDRDWRAALRYRGFSGGGVEVERAFELGDGWRLRGGVQGLVLRHWRERSLDGTAGYRAADGSYRFDLRSVDSDDRDRPPFQSAPARHGVGLLFHAELGWRAADWHATLGLRDAGWLHWRGMPRQDATLASETREVDADGFVVYRPLVQGRNARRTRTEGLSPRLHGELGRAIGPGWLIVGAEGRRELGLLPRLAWAQRSGAVDWRATWQWHERRLTLSANWQGWQVAAGADRLGGDARSRSLALAYTRAF